MSETENKPKDKLNLKVQEVELNQQLPSLTKISRIAELFGVHSETEKLVLYVIASYADNKPVNLTADMRKDMCAEIKISHNSFNSALKRLNDAKVIYKDGSYTVTHPAFRNMQECDGILVKFKQPEKRVVVFDTRAKKPLIVTSIKSNLK